MCEKMKTLLDEGRIVEITIQNFFDRVVGKIARLREQTVLQKTAAQEILISCVDDYHMLFLPSKEHEGESKRIQFQIL